MSCIGISNDSLEKIINQAEVLKLAKQVSGQNVEKISYELRAYRNDSQIRNRGYLKLFIEFKSEGSSAVEQYSFFVKTLPTTNNNLKFERELTYFQEIVPQLMKHVDVGRWIPKCFLAKTDILVFEDVGTESYERSKFISDEETARSALRSVARLHASSILAEVRLENSLLELYPNFFKENSHETDQWYSEALNTAIKIADNLSLNSSKITAVFDRFQQILTEENETQSKWKVVSHGNLWTKNILFDNSQPVNCLLVNFQSVGYASPAQDVLSLLHSYTTREFRQKFEKNLIDFYHSTLRTLSYKYNPAARVLSMDQLKIEIEQQRLRAIVGAAVYLPITLLNDTFAADVLENFDEYDKFQTHDRAQKVIELMQKNEVYRQRLEDSVRELVDYSEKYF